MINHKASMQMRFFTAYSLERSLLFHDVCTFLGEGMLEPTVAKKNIDQNRTALYFSYYLLHYRNLSLGMVVVMNK